MEKTVKKQQLPDTDSIDALASFWDQHDLTDFESDLEEADGPVFSRAKRRATLSIDLAPTEAQRLKKIARTKGLKETTVARQWIIEKLQHSSSARQGRRPQPSARKVRTP